MSQRRGLLLIISSPSGAGKSTLSRALQVWDATIRFSVSATTRKPRTGEVDGKDYYFQTVEQFNKSVKDGEMLEHAEVFGNFYGSPMGPVQKAMEQGHDTLFDIDWQGGQQIRNSSLGQDVVSVFILPPSMGELENRLRGRGQDSDEVISGRMEKSQAEISHWAEYDYVLVNRELGQAEADLKTILTAERLRRERQPKLSEFVRGLDAEMAAKE